MLSGQALLESYKVKALSLRDMSLFPAGLAVQFIDACERNEIRLLGLDAFEPPEGESIRCRLEDCLDVSRDEYWDYRVEELCQVVREFVSARPSLLFEFVVDE